MINEQSEQIRQKAREELEHRALEFLREFCGVRKDKAVGDSVGMCLSHKDGAKGFWIVDSKGNKRRLKEVLAAFAESLLSGGAATDSDITVSFKMLDDNTWSFGIAPLSDKNRGGVGTAPTLESAVDAAMRMLPRVFYAWFDGQKSDAGAAPPAASPQECEHRLNLSSDATVRCIDCFKSWKIYSSEVAGDLRLQLRRAEQEVIMLNKEIESMMSDSGTPATQDHKSVSNAFDKTCATCGRVHN